MEIAILLAVVFGLSAGALFFWGRAASRRAAEVAADAARFAKDRDEARADASRKAEKLAQKTAELDDVKEKLRTSKQKLHEERDPAKRSRDIDEARAEGERQAEARIQNARVELEEVRGELKVALAELETYRAGKRKPAPPRVEAAPERRDEPRPAPKPAPEKPAEPTPEDVARQESAERQLTAARRKVEELEGEVKRVRGRAETNNRVYLVAKGELEAAKDRLRTLEEKHNALARENDVLRRALEKLQPANQATADAPAPTPAPPVDAAVTQ